MSRLLSVIDGISQIEELSRALNSDRNAAIEICNHMEKYHLTNPRTYSFSGDVCDPPHPTVKNDQKAMCSFSKQVGTATGCVGILMYDITSGSQVLHRLAIMFSVPFDYNLYENWFALGIFPKDQACDHDLYNLMYYKEAKSFTRGKAAGGNMLKHGESQIEVKGTMSNKGSAILKIEMHET
ncbi:DELTA-actitoxin-Ucs1a-like [Lepisosteus oculatus]|uniref:DELTA-actitoxin-Ucs1a-like n=1 Tax=Lepisosteus oculatus TaxID=7918 RepID=UPI00073FBA0C|nr:PREDICTED: DELTA-actitoxin-Ucs1a-like [Lepisosteus oculatus]